MDYRPKNQNPSTGNWYAPDIASEDMAAATSLVKTALPNLMPTVAFGISEGGAVTALMIEHHKGLVSSWVDEAGSVDLGLVYTQLYADQAPADTQNTDADFSNYLLDLLNRAVGNPADPTKATNDSPIQHATLLAGLKAAVIVHADGDEISPYSGSLELAGDLAADGVPTKVDTILPLGNQAPAQPAISNAWHSAAALDTQALAEINKLIGPSPVFPQGLQASLIPSVDTQR